MSDWWQQFYKDADNLDLDGLMSHFTDDATARFGNSKELVGKAAIRNTFQEFWLTIRCMKHNFFNVIESGNYVALESRIDYTLPDGQDVNVPCATVLRNSNGKIGEIRIYIDLAPVSAL